MRRLVVVVVICSLACAAPGDEPAGGASTVIAAPAPLAPPVVLRRRRAMLAIGGALLAVGVAFTGVGAWVLDHGLCRGDDCGDPTAAGASFLSFGVAHLIAGAGLLAAGLERRPVRRDETLSSLTEAQRAVERARARRTLVGGAIATAASLAIAGAGAALFGDGSRTSVYFSGDTIVTADRTPQRAAGVALLTIGGIASIPSLAVLFAGLSWRADLARAADDRRARASVPVVAPWIANGGGGLSISGRLQ